MTPAPTNASPTARPEGFEPILDDARALADYVAAWAVGDVCSETTWEHFRDCRGVLRWFDMSELSPQTGDGHRRIASRERRYRTMDPATCPPILVMDGIIEDGHHRHRVALKRGDAGMWGYDVSYVD